MVMMMMMLMMMMTMMIMMMMMMMMLVVMMMMVMMMMMMMYTLLKHCSLEQLNDLMRVCRTAMSSVSFVPSRTVNVMIYSV